MKWKSDHTGSLNSASSKSRQMQVSKGIETPVEEGVEKWLSTAEVSRRYRGTTHQNQEQKLDWSTRCREAIEDAEPFSIDPPGIEKLSGLRLEKAEEARQTTRYRGGVELAFKTSFSRCEKHRHECNPISNSTNDPINILSSQNHFSIKILSTWIFKKKYTHTLNKSNQFYISKTSQDSLVSIH